MSSWSAENKYRLLLAVITTQKINSHQWEKVAALMGGDISWNACRQQYAKIKKESGATLNIPDGEEDPSTPQKATPQKNKTPKGESGSSAKSTGRKRKQPDKTSPTSASNDDQEEEKPKKKVKKELIKEEPVKAEGSDDDIVTI